MILPNRVQDLLEYCADHLNTWETAPPADIGLSANQINELKGVLATAQGAYNAAVQADEAKRAATLASQSAVRALRSTASELIVSIKAFAANQTDPDAVYVAAQIPPRSAPTPAAPPGTPMDFRVTLNQDGSIELKWKCNNPVGTQGTIYEVRRKPVGTSGDFVFIGASGVRSFVDDTIPSGNNGVTYQVTAVRSTRRGNPAQFNVNFGVGGNGEVTASITPPVSVKLAA